MMEQGEKDSFPIFIAREIGLLKNNNKKENNRGKKMKKMLTGLLVISLLAVCACSLALDLNPPSWRNDLRTTYQIWEFNAYPAPNPAPPDAYNNTQEPSATITGSFPTTRWIATHLNRTGVWTTEDWIELYIPNTDITGPDTYKEVYLQMVYYAGEGNVMLVDVLPSPDPFTLGPVYTEVLPDGYTYSIWQIIIEPNPLEETLYLLPLDCTLYVDEIVVDTICVTIPEPGTMLMIAAGLTMLCRRKKS